ncbi:MAG TPA: hypothetical protein PKX15_09005 [Bacteroidales bacterium]|nr:hypothetical protein [Bacteroidales bacterium]
MAYIENANEVPKNEQYIIVLFRPPGSSLETAHAVYSYTDITEWQKDLMRYMANNTSHVAGKFIPVDAKVKFDLIFADGTTT